MTEGVERFVSNEGLLLAIVVKSSFQTDGISFFTPPESSQQLGYMKRPGGYQVAAHKHKVVQRTIDRTQEVLFIKSGSCQLDLYDEFDAQVTSVTLTAGDVVLLAEGGHGLMMLEDTEIIEVKQGPFSPSTDKTRLNTRDAS